MKTTLSAFCDIAALFCIYFDLLFLLNRHGFLVDVKKVLEHLMEDCNWPSINLLLGKI